MTSLVTADELSEYVDGGLSEQRRAEIRAWLLEDPQRAAEVERLQELNDALRGLGSDVLDEPVPERLREVVRRGATPAEPGAPSGARPKKNQTLVAAMIFAVGVVCGWAVYGVLDRRPSDVDVVLAEAVRAHAVFSSEENFRVEFPPEASGDFESLVTRVFSRAVAPPDLQAAGYVYRGALLVPTQARPSALLLFQGKSPDDRLTVALWQAGGETESEHRSHLPDDVASRHWVSSGFAFAVIGNADARLDEVANEVSDFYASS